MRGQRTYNELVKDSTISGTVRKGRSNALVFRRNECMLARYFYYGYLKNKSYEEIMRLLAAEFFLSPATISMRVQQNTDKLKTLKRSGPSMYYFQSRWPHLKW
jgi:hypothetical protein